MKNYWKDKDFNVKITGRTKIHIYITNLSNLAAPFYFLTFV